MPNPAVRTAIVAALMTVSVGVGFTACGNAENEDFVTKPSAADSVGTGTVSAKVDGAAVSATGANNVVVGRSGSSFSIVANLNSTTRVSLIMDGATTAGTYSLASGGLGAGQYASGTATWLSTLVGGLGTVTFTTLNTTQAVGTFSFTGVAVVGTTATGTKTITEGSFNVSFGK